MAARTIRSGIGSFKRPDGEWTHGVLGDVVDVHEDDLERFDRLNPVPLAGVVADVLADVVKDEEAERAEREARVEAEVEERTSAAIAGLQAKFDEAVRAAAEKLAAENAPLPAIVERTDGTEVPVGEDGIPVLESSEDVPAPAAKSTRRTAK